MAKNPLKVVDNLVLRFIRRFYQADIPYTSKLYEKWLNEAVQAIIWVMFNGFLFWLGLAGIGIIFPELGNHIFIGTESWHIPIIIFDVGIVLYLIKGLYRFFRIDYKNKGV